MAAESQNRFELHVNGVGREIGSRPTAPEGPGRGDGRHQRGARYHRRSFRFAKRLTDLVLATVALLVLFPLYLAIVIAIAISDGFPVAFKQIRVGQGGELFEIYKFRTMVRNAEDILHARPELLDEYRRTFKIENDPRIFRIGHFLRRSSLDELPQLFNVVLGNMSLVGPRPIVEPELDKYGDQQHVYTAMKPGCAGLWQCMGRSATTYAERVELDREYYENASPAFDIAILIRTVLAILLGKGAQ